MGCNPSKSNGADAGTAVDVLEIGLELSDSDSRVLAENPLEVSREVVRESVSTVGAMFREVRPQLELMFPVALVGRCILNEMIDSTEPAYVGGIIEGLMLEVLQPGPGAEGPRNPRPEGARLGAVAALCRLREPSPHPLALLLCLCFF